MADNRSWQLTRKVLLLRPSRQLHLHGAGQQAVAEAEKQLMQWQHFNPAVVIEEIQHYKAELVTAILAHTDAEHEGATQQVEEWWKALHAQAQHMKQQATRSVG